MNRGGHWQGVLKGRAWCRYRLLQDVWLRRQWRGWAVWMCHFRWAGLVRLYRLLRGQALWPFRLRWSGGLWRSMLDAARVV